MIYLLFALLGLLAALLLNVLADDLPARARVRRPHCTQCDHGFAPAGWLALGRLMFQGGHCPQCGRATARRAVALELGLPLLFALLPLVFTRPGDLIFGALYTAILILIIITDLEHRLILHIVTFPSTLLALLGSFFVSHTNLKLALIGAVVGFVAFYLFFLLGQFLFGPGALGFGDVTLSMTMGAMLGFPYIVFALVIGILLGGAVSLLLVFTRRRARRSYIPYGPYLALGGLLMLWWGAEIFRWYIT